MKTTLLVLLAASAASAQQLTLTPDGFQFTADGPWELMASSSPSGPFAVIKEVAAGGTAQLPPAALPGFYRARTMGFERVNRSPTPTPAKTPSAPAAVDFVFFTSFSSDTRYESVAQDGRRHWHRNTELWGGGNLATYRYSTAGNDMCPTGGMVCFEYAAPLWDRRLLFTDGCDVSLYPGMAAEFSMDYVQAAITNSTMLAGVRDTSEATIHFGTAIEIAGPTNKAFWVEVGIRALEATRDPLCSEWYPDRWVDARELGMAGRRPHFLYGEWAFYQYLVHGGDKLDATPTPPLRPYYWFVDYCIERLR